MNKTVRVPFRIMSRFQNTSDTTGTRETRHDAVTPPRAARRGEKDKRPLTGELLAYTNRCSGREIEVMTKPTTSIEAIAMSCIAGRLRLLNRVVTNLYDNALRPFGVRLSQGNVLAVTAKLDVARPA